MTSVSRMVLFLMTSLLAMAAIQDAGAAAKTICTITVNSADEKEAFRRALPADEYRFVELVERGRPDWLASACRQGTRCDVLVISGHYDGRDEFYSDQPGTSEFLPMEEMERASCSLSCASLFSQLKEVYLFGCNTLNPEALKHVSAEVSRSLIRSGHSPADAERLARSIASLHDGSSRNRMRLVFDGVPAIYGFSGKAPVGPVAASLLDEYFRSGGGAEIGSRLDSGKLLSHFSATSMAVSSGVTSVEALSSVRQDMCRFSSDDLTAPQKLAFVHDLLGREMAEVRPFLDRLEKYVGSLSDMELGTPGVREAMTRITRDDSARSRFLAFARDADEAVVRARMVELAHRLGWLSLKQRRSELAELIRSRLEAGVGPADVALTCGLNGDHELASIVQDVVASSQPKTVGHAAVLACLGDADATAQVLAALTSPRDADFEIAHTYIHYRPLDESQLRGITAEIANIDDARVQARAIDALACQHLSDVESLHRLARMFLDAKTAAVQTAIADVLLRSDYDAIATPQLARSLRDTRIDARDCAGAVDALIRRLEAR